MNILNHINYLLNHNMKLKKFLILWLILAMVGISLGLAYDNELLTSAGFGMIGGVVIMLILKKDKGDEEDS